MDVEGNEWVSGGPKSGPCWTPQKQHSDSGRRHTRQLGHGHRQQSSPMSPGDSLGGFPQRWCVWQTGRASRCWPSSCPRTRPEDARFPPEETQMVKLTGRPRYSCAIMCLIIISSFSCCICPFNVCPKTISGLWKIPPEMIWLLFLFTIFIFFYFWSTATLTGPREMVMMFTPEPWLHQPSEI